MKFRFETEFKETEIGEIPKDWEVKKLGEVYELQYGITTSSSAYGNCKLLRQTDLKNGYIERENIPYANVDEDLISKYSLQNDDIVISRIANIGAVGYIDFVENFDRPVVFGSYLLRFRKKKEFNNKYAFYFILSSQMQEFIKSIGEGSTRQNTNAKVVAKFPLVCPPLPEQSRIATVLSYFDDLIENKKKQNKILEEMAMAIFKNWFVDFEPFKDGEFVYSEELGREIPKGWEVKAIGSFIKFLYGKGLPENKRKEGPYPVVGSSGIVGYHSQYLISKPAIIIGRKGNVGSVYLMLEPSYPIDTVFYSSDDTPNELLSYIYHYLKITFLEDLGATDTAVPGLNIHILNSVKILVPDGPILSRFNSLVEPLFQKIILNQKQIMTLKKIRDALLPLLVFGKLRVEEI